MDRQWAVLWVKGRDAPDEIATYIDVEHDPIIQDLQGWLTDPVAAEAPPSYPSVTSDPRPLEPVPALLAARDRDVLPIFRTHGIHAHFREHEQRAYTHGLVLAERGEVVIETAVEPVPERLRQWRRITRDQTLEELLYADVVQTLGWTDIQHSAGDIKRITEALLLKRGVATSAWFRKDGSRPALWRWTVCLDAMRTAGILLAVMRASDPQAAAFVARSIVDAV
jgi:hypothetical protein